MLTCVGASALFKSCAQNDSQCLCTNRKFVREVSHCLERECGTDGDVAREYLSAVRISSLESGVMRALMRMPGCSTVSMGMGSRRRSQTSRCRRRVRKGSGVEWQGEALNHLACEQRGGGGGTERRAGRLLSTGSGHCA